MRLMNAVNASAAVVTAFVLGLGALPVVSDAQAGSLIPYPNVGTPNPVTYTFTAPGNGDVIAYFAGSGASFDEQVGMLVNGVATGVVGLDDHSSTVGQSLDLGFAAAGSVLTFFDVVANIKTTWYSNPALNGGDNHVYSTPYDGVSPPFGGLIPAGTYVAFEDLPFSVSDFNYFDDTFVFVQNGTPLNTNTPLPAALPLFASGLGLMGFLAKRRKRKNATAPAAA